VLIPVNDLLDLHCGDCLDVLPTLQPDSVDACITDPPYGLEFMGKEWDAFGKEANHRSFERSGFGLSRFGAWTPTASMDGVAKVRRGNLGFQEFSKRWATEVYRVLRPGAHLAAFGGTRTYHRMACAIEDAGFEIRDCLMWLYGTGFPKSHDISKAIDAAAGAQREIVGQRKKLESYGPNEVYGDGPDHGGIQLITAPATDAVRQWEGWGTALKPAVEPIVLARKPLSEPTVAANVLRWGTGALNIDECRIATNWATDPTRRGWQGCDEAGTNQVNGLGFKNPNNLGRWPANVVHDGSEEVVGMFPSTKGGVAVRRNGGGGKIGGRGIYGGAAGDPDDDIGYGDSGSAARFFYSAKADADDRLDSKHPTVKPIDLLRWLVRLVTPPGGLVIDPFAGTGTTASACLREGCCCILIEREQEYVADIKYRFTGLGKLRRGTPNETAMDNLRDVRLSRYSQT